jgi:hypothetical protein
MGLYDYSPRFIYKIERMITTPASGSVVDGDAIVFSESTSEPPPDERGLGSSGPGRLILLLFRPGVDETLVQRHGVFGALLGRSARQFARRRPRPAES